MKPLYGIRYKKMHPVISGIFTNNPSLALGFDLPFLIATSTSLKNAVAMSVEMFFVHMVTMLMAVTFMRKTPPWQRALVSMAISTVMMMLTRELLTVMFTDISNSLGMYMYLLSVNGLTLYQSLSMHENARIKSTMRRELYHVIAFILTMFSLSFIREYFGAGMIWGNAVPMPFKAGGLLMPFCGFIFMGFLLAIVKFFNKRLIGLSAADLQRREERYFIRPR